MKYLTLEEVLKELHKFNPHNEVQRELYALQRRLISIAREDKDECKA